MSADPTTSRSRFTAVVCDDDGTARSVISRLLTTAGFEVAGEADAETVAATLIEQVAPELLVLDLALTSGSGESLLRTLAETRRELTVVIFSAYVRDPAPLLAGGASAVVDKPDFATLEAVVTRVHDRAEALTENRRPRPSSRDPLPPPPRRSVSGFEPWSSFESAASMLTSGDAIVVLDVLPTRAEEAAWDTVFLLDYRTALGRTAASTRREQDRVSVSPHGLPCILLLGGHAEAATALFGRIQARWERELATGVPVAGFVPIRDGADPLAELRRLVAAVETEPPERDQPVRLL